MDPGSLDVKHNLQCKKDPGLGRGFCCSVIRLAVCRMSRTATKQSAPAA